MEDVDPCREENPLLQSETRTRPHRPAPSEPTRKHQQCPTQTRDRDTHTRYTRTQRLQEADTLKPW